MPAAALDGVIDRALAEDAGRGDPTTDATIPADLIAVADVVFREPGIVCGLEVAHEVFRRLDPDAQLEVLAGEGALAAPAPCTVARIEATARAILTAERTALNLLQRLSGIATATHAYVAAVEGTGVEILDTRKTAPGLRALDKLAVACGGGTNHRADLAAAILIKDNHVALAGGVATAVAAARTAYPGLHVQAEADTLAQLDEALAAGADSVLLDNMPPADLRTAVGRTAGLTRLEASGGITLDSVRAIAETGVDAISIGALTHSVRALDISLEVHPCPR
ncbi:MAG TPA: carboxylating nicotinate-nucleotide diphosphorylase [Gaiellales bacterium]